MSIPQHVIDLANARGYYTDYKPMRRVRGWPTPSQRPSQLWRDGVCRSYTSLQALRHALRTLPDHGKL